MIIEKPFYYIRHGQTDWNVEGRFQGSQDIPLNDEGIGQAHRAKTLLENLPITHIYSSPLIRARATADIANSVLNLDITEISGLQECGFGVLEGTLRGPNNTYSEDWRQGMTPDKAETYVDFTARVFAAFNSVLENAGTPLIVAHGAVFWPVHSHMQLDLEVTLPNAIPIHLTPPAKGSGCWSMENV